MPLPKRHTDAFKENFNLIGLGAFAAASLALLNPLPLLAGVVVEAAYLLFVPDSSWYSQRLAKRFDAEVERRRAELKARVLPTLVPDMQERFGSLELARKQIGEQPMGEEKWFREVLRKLDYLIEKFLLFASKEVEYRNYLQSVLDEVHGQRRSPEELGFMLPDSNGRQERDRQRRIRRERERSREMELAAPTGWAQYAIQEIQKSYSVELEKLKASAATEEDLNLKAVLEKRLDVLQRRFDSVAKLGRILTNLEHQLQLVEDTFGLINDEIRARSPEQVLSDIEDVVWQTDTMTKLIEDLAPFDQAIARLG